MMEFNDQYPHNVDNFNHPSQRTSVDNQQTHRQSTLLSQRQDSNYELQSHQTAFSGPRDQQPHAGHGDHQIQETFHQAQGSPWQPGYAQEQVAVPAVDFRELHLSQLETVCHMNGIQYDYKSGKSGLIQLLEKHGAQQVLEYEEYDMRQLRKMQKDRGIRYDEKKCNKTYLIAALQEYDQANGTGGRTG
ncbi:hypothetical protein IMSHALPRED_009378 [Imshaugia aleurites]|uniref:Uncharacterized protein n=1 Tax=Imshaugia aleurites TaxID=172621 RepID=A0A8H3G2N8_9LECA|nr:hypothetical protein IMSHALPRED_009378 [Imshaugia aleurites]